MSALRLVVLLQLASLGNSGLAECAAQDDQTECAVLLEIASLGVTATGWKGGGTYCDWTGITCNTVPNTAEELIFNEALQRRELTHLILNDQKLAGKLTGNVSKFQKLNRLSLENNKLTGSVPSFNGNHHVKKIVLSRNDFSGTIPELSKNTKLEYFYLSNNVLTGKIPPTLSALSHLKWLSLGENKLDGTVPSLEKLSHLKMISMGNNALTGTFPNLNYANQLQFFDIRGNNFSAIHDGICNVSTAGFFRQPISTFFDKSNKCTIAYNPFECKKTSSLRTPGL